MLWNPSSYLDQITWNVSTHHLVSLCIPITHPPLPILLPTIPSLNSLVPPSTSSYSTHLTPPTLLRPPFSYRTKEYEDHLKIMTVEAEQMRSRLALAEKKAKEPSPVIKELQTKMDAMNVSLNRSFKRPDEVALEHDKIIFFT